MGYLTGKKALNTINRRYAILAAVILLIVVGFLLYSYSSQNQKSQSSKPIISPTTLAINRTITPMASSTTTIPITIRNATANSGDNTYIYVSNLGNFSSGGGSISVIKESTNKVVASIPAGMSAGQVVFVPNSVYAFALTQSGTSGYHNISVINYLDNQFIMNITLGNESITASGIALTPNGRYLYVIEPEGPVNVTVTNASGMQRTFQSIKNSTIQIINVSLFLNILTYYSSFLTTITTGSYSDEIVFTSNGNYAYVPNYESDSISVINTNSQSVISTIPITHPLSIMAPPTGKYVYVTYYKGK